MDNIAHIPWYRKKKAQAVLAVLAVMVLFSLFVMVINYSFPSFFRLMPGLDGQVTVQELEPADALAADTAPESASRPEWRKGLSLANTLVVIGDDLFSNWLPNDKIWPTVLLDNPQNFQLGELEMLRYTTRVLRDKLSRRTTDKIDQDCDEAFTLLSNDAFKWIMPSAESRFQAAVDRLRAYRDHLAAGEAGFVPSHDNLRDLLDQCLSLLGGINTRLANAPAHERDKVSPETGGGPEASPGEPRADTQVPWSRLDDNFYYAQGAAYVLRQVMVAVRDDFSGILADRKALPQVDSIIEVLDQTQFEPLLVLNGDVGSVMANHSMELHSLLENTRQKIHNLNDMLRQ